MENLPKRKWFKGELIKMKYKVNTIKELIKYCFYKHEGKIDFGFNEMWEMELDKNINPKLIKKIYKIVNEL